MRLALDKIEMFQLARYSVDIPWGDLEEQLEDHYGASYVLDLDPEFQRGMVWTWTQKVAYVEFCLRGGTYGRELFFNCPGWPDPVAERSTLQLVDGKQRLDAVRTFLAGDLTVFGGWTAAELPNAFYRANQRFHFTINGLHTRAEVLQWYLDINAGGTPHSPEEIERVRGLLLTALSEGGAA